MGGEPLACSMVLVHGGWHGPWCWEPILPVLTRAGVSTHTVELSMRSLAEDVETVRATMAGLSQGGSVVLVGHSYSGQVISGAGHSADRLVYVAAVAADEGESIIDSVGVNFGIIDGIEIDETTLMTRLTAASMPSFYGNSGKRGLDWALPQLRPLAAGCIADPLAGVPAWREVASHYFVSTEDELLPVDYQRACAAKIGRAAEIVADHSPFASAPGDLVAALLAVVAEVR